MNSTLIKTIVGEHTVLWESVKQEIGVYAIEIGGRIYIGSSVDISIRWKQHIRSLANGTHHSVKLQRSFNKHGNPEFTVVELCDESVLLEREQYWLDELNCVAHGLNICPVAGRTVGTVASDETRAKISAALVGNQYGIGNSWTEDHKKNHSDSLKGNQHLLGHVHTEDSKRKIGDALRGRKRGPYKKKTHLNTEAA